MGLDPEELQVPDQVLGFPLRRHNQKHLIPKVTEHLSDKESKEGALRAVDIYRKLSSDEIPTDLLVRLV
jgi:hypothetical protein